MDSTAPNPYQPPTSVDDRPEQATGAGSNASRGRRLGAATIDALLAMLIFVPIQFYAGVYRDFPNIKVPEFPESLIWMVAGIVITIVLHGTFLVRSAQTIGKKVLDIQIVNVSDGKPAPFKRIMLLRYLPMALVSYLPAIGGFLNLLNVLFIFRSDHRCVHDHIAGTRVVNVSK